MRIECNITQRCNARCLHCNKAVGYADKLFDDITIPQMKRAVDQIIEQKIRINRFTFCGGEPVLHRDLQVFIDEVARIPKLRECRILSNGLPVTQKMRDRIILPNPPGNTRKFRWAISPLDDPSNPYSGKNDPTGRYKGRVHLPFWISPDDVGVESNFESCKTRWWCGVGLDSSGWSACGKAVMFGNLLGLQEGVSMKEGDIEEHIQKPINDICKHCIYGVKGRPVRRGKRGASEKQAIFDRYNNGEISDVSPTFEKAFAKHNNLVELETELLSTP